MGLAATMHQQFHQPSGLLGRLAGWIMASRPSNIERSRWTIDLLHLRESDRVLEIGFGPGVAIQYAARLVSRGRVVGIDHSALMVAQARSRNRAAIKAGIVDVRRGSFASLHELGETFDKVYSINVLQFLPDYRDALRSIHSVLAPDGLLAMTFQPRHSGATAEDAQEFARTLSAAMTDEGFRDVTVRELRLKPTPAVCVLAQAPVGPR